MLLPGCRVPDQGNAMLTGEDGSRPYAPDLAGGSKGLPGSAYAAETVPRGTGWFIGLAAADQDGQDPDGLARTWVAEMCDAMHLDGHEPVLQSLRTACRRQMAGPPH